MSSELGKDTKDHIVYLDSSDTEKKERGHSEKDTLGIMLGKVLIFDMILDSSDGGNLVWEWVLLELPPTSRTISLMVFCFVFFLLSLCNTFLML